MMKIISHRGNLKGPEPLYENRISRILECILYHKIDCEIDVRHYEGKYYLSHDPVTKENVESLDQIHLELISKFSDSLYVHCKDLQTFATMKRMGNVNSFFHENDDYTQTSRGEIWAYPGKRMIEGYGDIVKSITVLEDPTEYLVGHPGMEAEEIENLRFRLSGFTGVCTDYPLFLKKRMK